MNKEDTLHIKINEEESAYHVYHVARLFYPYMDIKIHFYNSLDFNLENELNNLINIEINIDRTKGTITFKDINEIYDSKIEDNIKDENIKDENIKDENIKDENKLDKTFNFGKDLGKEDVKRSFYTFLKEKTKKDLPWGTLVGVRPVKLAKKLLKEGHGEEYIVDWYFKNYLVSSSKAKEVIEIAKKELMVLDRLRDNSIGIYIHMPFCPSKCSYCSFLTEVDKKGNRIKEYVEVLISDIKETGKAIKDLNLDVSMIYFGGGTPTAPNDHDFERIIKTIYEEITKTHDILEYTVECGRPDSLTYKKLKVMKDYGVTRISINPQSFNENTLERLGRKHSVEEIIEKYEEARNIGFNNINMDIIIGLPGETKKDIENTLNKVVELSPESVTVHTLALKKGSTLKEMLDNNNESKNELKNDSKFHEKIDIQKALSLSDKILKENGLNPYYVYRQKNILDNGENIGYTKQGYENIYNVAMMEDDVTIVSCGAGAITKIVFKSPVEGLRQIERESSYKDIRLYLEKYHDVMENKIRLMTLYKESLNQ